MKARRFKLSIILDEHGFGFAYKRAHFDRAHEMERVLEGKNPSEVGK